MIYYAYISIFLYTLTSLVNIEILHLKQPLQVLIQEAAVGVTPQTPHQGVGVTRWVTGASPMEQYQGPFGGGLRYVDLAAGDDDRRREDYWRMKAHSLSNCWRRNY